MSILFAAVNTCCHLTSCAGFKQGRGWAPFFGIGYGGFRGDNTSAMVTDKGIDFRQRVPVHKHFKIEVR